MIGDSIVILFICSLYDMTYMNSIILPSPSPSPSSSSHTLVFSRWCYVFFLCVAFPLFLHVLSCVSSSSSSSPLCTPSSCSVYSNPSLTCYSFSNTSSSSHSFTCAHSAFSCDQILIQGTVDASSSAFISPPPPLSSPTSLAYAPYLSPLLPSCCCLSHCSPTSLLLIPLSAAAEGVCGHIRRQPHLYWRSDERS